MALVKAQSEESMRPSFIIMTSFLAAGCDAWLLEGTNPTEPAASDVTWQLGDIRAEADGLNYFRLTGEVSYHGSGFPRGTQLDVRFYEDATFDTIIADTSVVIGDAIESAGESQAFEVGHYAVYLLPATSGYDLVCAQIRARDSNFPDYRAAGGCLAGFE